MKRTDINHMVRESLSEPYNRSLEDIFAEVETAPARRGRRLTRLLLFFVAAAAVGCASIPKGELQLGPKIAADMKDQQSGGLLSLSRGRPVYLEAYAYPQILETGDIWAGGPILVNLGREELPLDVLVGDLVKPDEPATPATPAAEEKVASRKKTKAKRQTAPKTSALVN
jgi:hypothetical protein